MSSVSAGPWRAGEGVHASPLAYSCGVLDRVSALRADDARMADAARDPGARAIVLWRDQCLLSGGRPVTVRPDLWPAREPVLLGRDERSFWFAADLSDRELPDALAMAGATEASNVRHLVGSVAPAEASMLAHARGILYWHRQQQFCGACGGATVSAAGGHHRTCTRCATVLFPRIEPAVITLVEAPAGGPARCLLGRHRGATSFSTLAGFVEIGESLEGAVRREVFEEVGVRIGDVAYQASQAWPFPAGIMLGFRAIALCEDIRPDGDEVVEARWFTRAELAEMLDHQSDSIESFLVETWLRDGE